VVLCMGGGICFIVDVGWGLGSKFINGALYLGT